MIKLSTPALLTALIWTNFISAEEPPNLTNPTQVFIFGTKTAKPTIQEVLSQFKPKKKVSADAEQWNFLEFEFNGADLRISYQGDPKEKQGWVNRFLSVGFKAWKGDNMNAAVFDWMRQMYRTQQLYLFKCSRPMEDRELAEISKFARNVNGVILEMDQGAFDSDLRMLIGPGNGRHSQAQLPELASATARRQRSFAAMKERGFTIMPKHPVITTNEEVILRTPQEVAHRVVCLMGVAIQAEAAGQFDSTAFIKKAGAWDAVSPEEKEFLAKNEKSSTLTWRYEAINTLLWALGKVDELPFPSGQSNAGELIKMVTGDPAGLIANAKLRDIDEILDQADLHYRGIWLARTEKRLKEGKVKLDKSVTYERLYALNWLRRYRNADWDDIETDS